MPSLCVFHPIWVWGGGGKGLPRGLGHNVLMQFSSLGTSTMELSETDFVDTLAIQNDQISYIKHVLAPLYVVFTLFGCWGGLGGGGPGFCLVSVLPYPGGGGWVGLAKFQGGWVSNPPPPQGGVGLCGVPWVYRASATSFFLLLQVPCNMFIYGVFTCHCISRVHAPRP